MGAGASNENHSIKQARPAAAAGGSTPSLHINTSASATPLRQGPTTPHFQQTPLSATRGGWLDTSAPGVWEYEAFPMDWKQFDSETSQRIEDAFVSGQLAVDVMNGGRLVTIQLGNSMREKIGAAVRNVRRLPVSTQDGGTPLVTSSSTRRASSGMFSINDPFGVTANVSALDFSAVDDNPDNLQPQLISLIEAHDAPVYGAMFSLSGDKIITGAKDGTCKYWELRTSYVVRGFEQHPGAVLFCAMSRTDESVVATGCDDFTARIFSVSDSSVKHELEGHDHKVYGVNFTCDGKHLVTVSMDGTLRIWDASTGAAIRTSTAHNAAIFCLQVSSALPYLAISAGDDTILASHDLRLAKTVTHRFQGHDKTLWGCDIRFDNGQFLSCGMDSKVMAWDPRNPSAPLFTSTHHKSPVHCVEYMPDGASYLSSARDHSLKLTLADTSTKELFSCEAHKGHVHRVAYNAATQVAMTCGSDQLVKIWQLPRFVD